MEKENELVKSKEIVMGNEKEFVMELESAQLREMTKENEKEFVMEKYLASCWEITKGRELEKVRVTKKETLLVGLFEKERYYDDCHDLHPLR
jgi:protein-arginine kinase